MSEKKVIKKSEDGNGSRLTELCPSNSSLRPSSNGLKVPYDAVCRQRIIRQKRKFAAQFNRELNHMIAMKMRAVDGIKLDIFFSIDD